MISITRQDYQSSEDSGNLKLNLFCRHCAGRGGARAGITPGRGNISGQPWKRGCPQPLLLPGDCAAAFAIAR